MGKKMDPRDKRSGTKRWKLYVLHGLRHRDVYQGLASEFNGERVQASDFFKKRILVSTDRLSRGIDFSKQRISWVVLFDWPRDASEYLRRAGRTGRGGSHGGVLSLVSGKQQVVMSKMITSAAIRGVSLQSQNMATDGPMFTAKFGCLERFNPFFRDWRSPAAAMPKQDKFPQTEGQREQTSAPGDIVEMQQGDSGNDMDYDSEDRIANSNWAPWSTESLGRQPGLPWPDGKRESESFSDSIGAGVSLSD